MSDEHRFAAASFSDFTGIEELHRSQTGAVYSAFFRYDKKRYVLKERKLPELGRAKDIMNEVILLRQLSHPNVVRCEGFFRDTSRKSLFIVLEYCGGGDLYRLVKSYKKEHRCMSEALIWHLFYQMCDGLKHLHENGIVHRDLKTMNVMYLPEGHVVKLADLGVSRQVSEDTLMLNTFYGTPLYLSPELVENKPYNEKTDIWSLGVIMYEMAALTTPFRGNTLMELGRNVLAGKYDAVPRNFSPQVTKCIRWMLNADMTQRPNIVQLLRFVGQRRDEHSLSLDGPARFFSEPELDAADEHARRVDRFEEAVNGNKQQQQQQQQRQQQQQQQQRQNSSVSNSNRGGGEGEADDTDSEGEVEEAVVLASGPTARRNLAGSGSGSGSERRPRAPAEPVAGGGSGAGPQAAQAAPLPTNAPSQRQPAASAEGPTQPTQPIQPTQDELSSRFGDKLDPSKYRPLPRRGVGDEPSAAPPQGPGYTAGVGGWLPDGSSMPSLALCRDGQHGSDMNGAPRSARRRVVTASDRDGGQLYETLGGTALAQPRPKTHAEARPQTQQHQQQHQHQQQDQQQQQQLKQQQQQQQQQQLEQLKLQRKQPHRPPARPVAVDYQRVKGALRRAGAALRKLLQARDFASQVAQVASSESQTQAQAHAPRKLSPQRDDRKGNNEGSDGAKPRRHQRPSKQVAAVNAYEQRVLEGQRLVSFLEAALDSGWMDADAPEAQHPVLQERGRGLSGSESAPESRASTPAAQVVHAPAAPRVRSPSGHDEDCGESPRTRVRKPPPSLPLPIAHNRFEPQVLVVAPAPAASGGGGGGGAAAAAAPAARARVPRARSVSPPALHSGQPPRSPRQLSRPELKLHLENLAHPPLGQVIAHDNGPVLPVFVEHEYRGHLEPHQRVRTPRQLGMEGPGPGSPAASPRALKAAQAHVRFRSRPHSAIAAARDIEHPVSPPRRERRESKERVKLEPGLYPAGGLFVGGLVRSRAEPYASKERLPGIPAPPVSPVNTNTNINAHDGFFSELASNANHAKRFHRKAPLSSGDAHRGESTSHQKRKPSNEKMKLLLESDDGPEANDRQRQGGPPEQSVFQM